MFVCVAFMAYLVSFANLFKSVVIPLISCLSLSIMLLRFINVIVAVGRFSPMYCRVYLHCTDISLFIR